MKSISIDLETWGGVEISKSGVYRYAEAEDFAILLFGYSALTCRCWACTWTMTEGKALIRYFSAPPFHEPTREKWELFKSYNHRDVEMEMAIQKRLSKYPVPQSVWNEYVLDQEINDRGIRLDMPLVENAVRIDAITKDKLMDRLKTLTGLENPNSVAQMKEWLKERGVETESLDKKSVTVGLQ